MTTISLKRTGQKMPLVGYVFLIFHGRIAMADDGSVRADLDCGRQVNKETCADTVYNAIKAGYRLFDAAADYGNEKQAGEGLRRALQEGIVRREEIFITSKATIPPPIACP
ncbi:NADP-dependent oxidoreductase domain-containing protein [Pisolithus croceorrhizus]|nr:NADP-dependent oxidoreductase domain-containing protein [Pisolithus croceorrhizus]